MDAECTDGKVENQFVRVCLSRIRFAFSTESCFLNLSPEAGNGTGGLGGSETSGECLSAERKRKTKI